MSGYASNESAWVRWSSAAVLAAAWAVACGDDFTSSDCKATRTCSAATQGGEGGESVESASGAPHGELGSGGDGDGDGAGGEGGALPPSPRCIAAADCDNGDARDGAEVCVDGACLPGDPPPRVVSVTPSGEGEDAEPGAPIVIEFSEALDLASVVADAVQLLDGSDPVPGKLSYADRVATFVPERPLRLHGSYEVVVDESVADEAGNPMVAPFRSTFAVRDGSWHLVEIPKRLSVLATQAPLTPNGSVLLLWAGNGTSGCPVAAGWLELGKSEVTPTLFAQSATSCGSPLADASGVGGVVSWSEDGSSYVQQYRASAWEPKATQATTNTESWLTAVATSPRGVVTRFDLASRVGGVRAQRTNEAGAWQMVREEVIPQRLRVTSELAIAFDDDGNGLVAAATRDTVTSAVEVVASRYTTTVGKWTSAQAIPGSQAVLGAPVVEMAPSGEAMMVWATGGWLWGSYYHPEGGWFSAELISRAMTVQSTTEGYASLTYDGAQFVAAWFGEPDDGIQRAYTARYTPAEGWGTAEGHDAKAPLGLQEPPQLVSDRHGTLLLVWRTSNPLGYPLVHRRFVAGSWEPIAPLLDVTIPGRARLRATAMNEGGIASIVWPEENAEAEWVSIRVARFY